MILQELKRIANKGVIIMLVALSICSCLGCNNYFMDGDTNENESTPVAVEREVVDIDESLPPSMGFTVMGITSITEGYYYVSWTNGKYYITFYDVATGTMSEWCNRADCNHTDASICSALFPEDMYKRWMRAYKGYMYQIKFAEDGGYLMRRKLDGSELKQVSKLWDYNAAYTDVESDSENNGIVIHSGYIYYVFTEDYKHMSIKRMLLDGSSPAEVIYEWEQDATELKRRMRCDKDAVYIYGINHNSDSFIVRHSPDTGACEELYRKTVDGKITGVITDSVQDVYSFDKGLVYNDEYSKTHIYYADTGEIVSLDEDYGKPSSDGKYLISTRYKKITIADFTGKIITTIDAKEYFPNLEQGILLMDGADNRCFIFMVSSHDGHFVLHRQDMENGVIRFEQIART